MEKDRSTRIRAGADHVPAEVSSAEEAREPLSPAARAGRPYPLNSKRLTSPYLRCVARAMELPTKGAVDETRLIIEGKLVGMGRDPLNVQVLVAEDSHGREFVSLRDVGGVFVEAGALEKIEKEEESTGNNEGSRGEEEES